MNVLAIETTGAKASVAIIDEKGNIIEENSSETLNHLQFLMKMIGKLLEKSQLHIDDVALIAASEGPGSFTGIRIGVSSARALSQSLDIECIGVPTLKTFLYNTPSYPGIFCPIFNARRSQIYGGCYKWGEKEEICELIEGNAYTLDEFLRLLEIILKNQHIEATFFGDGVDAYRTQIEEWQNISLNSDIQIKFAPEGERYQKAASVAQMALRLFEEGKSCNYNNLEPNYMRKAEAERKLDEARESEKCSEEAVDKSLERDNR